METRGQTCADYVVQLNAQVQVSPPQINLSWKSLAGTSQIFIYRKAKDATSWGSSIGNVAGTATSFTDNNIAADSAYEYFVTKSDGPSYGYIYAGIKAPPIHNRGAILLLVDATFTDSCKTELTRLMKDISGDGWEVLRKDFSRTTSVVTAKNYIVSASGSNPNLKAVLIVGHVAVPYSGELNPDGHPDHLGAWPADTYYGDINGAWTDGFVNNTSASRNQNDNIPGDGKYDQSAIPSDLELQVSRIDFNDMPAFTASQSQLLRSYLNKDHSYKMDSLNTVKRALIDDNFGKFSGEGFGASGYRLAPLVGKDSIRSADFIATLNTDSYQWAYGCGGGSYTSAGGIGNTANFSANNVNAVFTMLFGSYFGDWDAQNNFLRAPLCSNTPALTCVWAGRPHWYFHHMALGEQIGYSAIVTQNNNNTYQNPVNYAVRGVHMALMGDLTLRTDYIKPVQNVAVTNTTGAGAVVTWTVSPDAGVIGYYVYRSAAEYGSYEKRSAMITGTSYTDSTGYNGNYFYMVRAVKLQSTPSGTYYNLSIGRTDSSYITYPHQPTGISNIMAAAEITAYPNPASSIVNLQINSTRIESTEMSIIDMQGRTLIADKLQLNVGTNLHTVPIHKLSPGVYIIQLRSSGGISYVRMVKSE